MQGQRGLSCSPSRPVPISARHLPRARGRNRTLIVVRVSLTTLKAVVAEVTVEIFSAASKAVIAAFNEVIVPSLRFCRLVVENMVVEVRTTLQPAGGEDRAQCDGRSYLHVMKGGRDPAYFFRERISMACTLVATGDGRWLRIPGAEVIFEVIYRDGQLEGTGTILAPGY